MRGDSSEVEVLRCVRLMGRDGMTVQSTSPLQPYVLLRDVLRLEGTMAGSCLRPYNLQGVLCPANTPQYSTCTHRSYTLHNGTATVYAVRPVLPPLLLR